MGVNPTPSNFKTFTFDNTNSAQYGVYITGQGVFNAPERNVEMVEIPGRDGAYALDKGNFNNIEVTYPAGIFADTESDFATAVSDLRNFLCSKEGYVRLKDDYNTGEYRMAIYKSGLEVEHEGLINGEFEITFECKPQRFLTSGETAISVTSGDTVTNPTRFPSKPMIEAYGYGTIDIDGAEIKVTTDPLGLITVYDKSGSGELCTNVSKTTSRQEDTHSTDFNDALVVIGDTFTVSGSFWLDVLTKTRATQYTGAFTTVSGIVTNESWFKSFDSEIEPNYYQFQIISYFSTSFVYGTSATQNGTATVTVPLNSGSNTTFSLSVSVAYDGGNTVTYTLVVNTDSNGKTRSVTRPATVFPLIKADSTYPASAQPTYIDLDIGEAYGEVAGEWVSLNNAVTIPAELPTLKVGGTEITFPNTFSQIDLIPRWWKV